MSKVKLLCFPHAGGGALYYSKWKNIMENIDFSIMQYPMRENKVDQVMPDSISKLAYILFEEERKNLNSDYAIWGHSMGSAVGYEFIKLCQKHYLSSPILFFSTGASAPCDISKKAFNSTIDDDKLSELLLSYGGIDKNILAISEFCQYYFPIIKKDMEILSNYKDSKKEKINCPIFLLNGDQDDVNIERWAEYSNWKVISKKFVGGHFFINDYQDEVSSFIEKNIEMMAEKRS